MKAQATLGSMAKSIFCLLLTLAMLMGGICPIPKAHAEETGVLSAKVILRKSADKDSRALQTLPKGDEVVLLNSSGDWYKINYGIYTGYVMKKYVTVSKNSSIKQESKPSSEATPPGAMRIGDHNSDVKKLQQKLKELGYYKGKLDGAYGEGTTSAVQAYQQDHKLEADGVAGRSTVKALFGSCSKVSMTTQPAPGSTSTPSKTPSASPSTSKYKTVKSISEIGSAPSATKEGDSGTNVVKLQQALECLGYYNSTIDGNFGAGTTTAVKRLQKNRGMTQDGIAGAGTIRVIFGKDATKQDEGSSSSGGKKHQTEVLDWFKDNVSSVIPKNAKFTIKDVRTGKTFQAVRWSGVNHLDAEPRTADDTATMKNIYGGSWSWDRRPILVLYNGHVYAASMNGMPHGTTTISNGFEGHFCIHFKNSKTHGTQKIDADHQNAVSSASKAKW
ncbi:MAG: peptidoglycan-binding protein [Clostridia bacterium]